MLRGINSDKSNLKALQIFCRAFTKLWRFMENFISITILNDFIFCPYSIYLHQIYSLNKEDIYHSFFQTKGKRLHDFIENNKDEKSWKNAFVASSKLGVYGRIDVYDAEEKELIEYKSVVAIAYKGYYYQIWAQYYCLLEMGVPVLKLAFYDFKVKKKISIPVPGEEQYKELKEFILKVKHFDFTAAVKVNPNKCNKCIYNNLCERKS